MTDLWHQLVLIWIHHPARFQEYLAEMAPIVTRYGGAADQIFTPTAIQADGLTTPDAANLVHYDSRTAFDAFSADPAFLKIKHLRDTSVDLRTFDGRLTQANPTRPGADRVYLIEIGHAPELVEPALTSDDRRTEYTLDVEPTCAADRPLNRVRISSFPSPAQRAAFDCAHDPTGIIRIDTVLSPAPNLPSSPS
ncbi:MAG TPA: DUF1330 domain-containing protein [Actinophytocola sp.]|uniref:DUF1330 domain-containing protein n=1 Tax=Actinophytocola sp. TaxID=1872138 RepID=UPI002DFD35AB|nr:DUF1330 domain-containing protein [Actinophytocola sp.]